MSATNSKTVANIVTEILKKKRNFCVNVFMPSGGRGIWNEVHNFDYKNGKPTAKIPSSVLSLEVANMTIDGKEYTLYCR